MGHHITSELQSKRLSSVSDSFYFFTFITEESVLWKVLSQVSCLFDNIRVLSCMWTQGKVKQDFHSGFYHSFSYFKSKIFFPLKRCSFTKEQRLPQGLGNESPKCKQLLAQNDIIKLALQ